MDLLTISAICGIVGGIGLILGIGTGIARGRHGMPRGRTLLMAAFYPVAIFPVAGVSSHLLLSFANIHLWDPDNTDAFLQALFAFTIAGLLAAASSTSAAFFAHTLAWNRHHARKPGPPQPTPPPQP
jgi:hypothetical protein